MRYFYVTPDDYDIAEKNGIPQNIVYDRVINGGWDVDKAVSKPVRKKKYSNWIKKAAQNGISRHTFYARVKRGMSLEEAVTKEVMTLNQAAEIARANIRKKPSWVRTAMENGIKRHTFYARVYKGWSKAEAATRPTMSHSESIQALNAHESKARIGYKAKCRKGD